jgi:glycine cleavage system transcriptional repressor
MHVRYPHAYVLNVVSDDHPGIIAAVSDAVSARQGNIDTVSQTVLDEYFTLIMIVSFPQAASPQAIENEVRSRAAGLQVVARAYEPSGGARPQAEMFVITATGPDQPGIIRDLSHYLSGKSVNIVDLYWNVDQGRFVMVSQVQIPAGCDLADFKAGLETIASRSGFTVLVQHENVFVATNELRLTRSPGVAAKT